MLRASLRRLKGDASSITSIEQVRRSLARVPTLEGYQRPEKAPLPEDLRRERFHQFMMGKPDKYPIELKTYALFVFLCSWCVGLCAFTFYKMRPDDFEWIEEHRSKAEAYKQRMVERDQPLQK